MSEVTADPAAPESNGHADPSRIRVFLVDDHELVRLGLRTRLQAEEDLDFVGEAGSVRRAIELIPDARPHVVVVDIGLHDGDGLELAREIRTRLPAARFVVLSASEDRESLHRAIVAGASAYVLKDGDTGEVVEAIRAVGSGGSMVEGILGRYLEQHQQDGGESRRLGTLTPQERRILDLLAEGLTNRQIAQRMFLAEKTVRNHVSNVLGKLQLSHRTQAALFAVEHGRSG